MNFSHLIYSRRWWPKLARHLLFWLVYGIFYFTQSIVPGREKEFNDPQIYITALISISCFLPACVVSVYVSVYMIWPYFLKGKKYFGALVMVAALFAVDLCINVLLAEVYVNHRNLPEQIKMVNIVHLGYLNTIWAASLIGLALFIKISKESYRQQKENLEIARKKMRTELDVEKSRLQPAYLYGSLNTIHDSIISGKAFPDRMILKLSDVVSYTLYEGELDLVPIRTELDAVQDFIDLETLKDNGFEHIRLNATLKDEKFGVPPMLILSFLQEAAGILKELAPRSWTLGVQVTGRQKALSVTITVAADFKKFPNLGFAAAAAKMRSRLGTAFIENDYTVEESTTIHEFSIGVTFYHSEIVRDPENKVILL